MKRSNTPALAAGMGVVAGLRSMVAPAVVALAAERGLIRIGNSPIALVISSKVSKKTIELALSEVIADKLPFTPDRTNPGPLVARIVSGAICGAALCAAAEQPLRRGAMLGGLGAVVGAFAGYHLRKRLSREMPSLVVALAEDVLAITGGVAIVLQVGRAV
jgi:uncharacterized membrane protein